MDENLKIFFIKLCEQVYTFDGEFHFPFGKIQLNDEYEFIVKSDYYPTLMDKMDSFLILLNSDSKYWEMDIQDELWHLI